MATKKSKDVIQCDSLSFAASEAFKMLRNNLQFSFPNDNKQCHIIGMTSSLRSEGKSTTAVLLAYTLAQSGKRVLLIDADMRLPTIHSKLDIKGSPGLSNLLAGLVQSKDALVVSEYFKQDKWYILPAGDIPPNPSELLGSNRMRMLLESYSQAFNYIIIDLPPVNIVSDALSIASWIDGLVVVVRENQTTRSALADCMFQMEKIGPKFLGFIMSDADINKGSYGKRYGRFSRYGSKRGYGYGYGYGHGYGYGYGYGHSYGSNAAGDSVNRESFEAATDARPKEINPQEKNI